MSDNLTLYNAVRVVPAEAQKAIGGGRLKGMTDINPMWRIKVLTEQFGICGIGWKYEITNQRLEPGGGEQIAAFVDINLYCKQGDGWSEPIPGTGGSMFVVKESKGLYTDDECFKKALTDALSVACKALGVGADIYWNKDKTKYNGNPATVEDAEDIFNPELTPEDEEHINNQQPPTDTGGKGDQVRSECEVCKTQMTQAQMKLSKQKYDKPLCPACQKKEVA